MCLTNLSFDGLIMVKVSFDYLKLGLFITECWAKFLDGAWTVC